MNMNKMFAVALLDMRRLGTGLVSTALVAGLVPAAVSGMGFSFPAASAVTLVLILVGLASGGVFGTDFTEGRGSFFFARPLPVSLLIGGRIVSLVTLATLATAAAMASNWLSTSDRTEWRLWILTWWHGAALITSWVCSLYIALAIAASGPQERAPHGLRETALVPLRIGLLLGGTLVVFGLFADLTLRAYFTPTPVRLFFAAWVVGGLVASLVAIVFGRTERLRIARFQNRVMLGHLALTVAVVLAAWSYVLHPGPRAIRLVTRAQGSPDGAFAYVQTQVDRGDPSTFKPTFLLDLAAGRSLLLNADPFQGPWPSADGRLMVWSEATPFFFRPIWRLVGGTTSLRVQKEGVDVQPLPLPRRMTERFAPGTEYFINSVESVLPSPDGSVFAIVGNRRLTFVSRTTGERPDVDLGPGAPSLRAMAFVPSGALRTLLVRNGSAGPLLEWADIDPASNRVTKIASTEAGGQVRVQFNRNATSALLTVTGGNAARSSLSLMRVDDADPAAARPTVLLPETPVPRAIFLADGRIATTSGGMHQTVLKVFSATGAPLLSTALSDGVATIEAEMFPGLVAIGMGLTREIAIVDCSNGNIVRRIPGMTSPISYAFASPNVPAPPPGTPGARLLLSQGKLFDLATPSAEPRLLLPVAR